MMISCGGRNTSDASIAGLRKKVFKAYLALAKCRVFFARHFPKRHILTMDGGWYVFFAVWFLLVFTVCQTGGLNGVQTSIGVERRSSHLHRCIYVKKKNVQPAE